MEIVVPEKRNAASSFTTFAVAAGFPLIGRYFKHFQNGIPLGQDGRTFMQDILR